MGINTCIGYISVMPTLLILFALMLSGLAAKLDCTSDKTCQAFDSAEKSCLPTGAIMYIIRGGTGSSVNYCLMDSGEPVGEVELRNNMAIEKLSGDLTLQQKSYPVQKLTNLEMYNQDAEYYVHMTGSFFANMKMSTLRIFGNIILDCKEKCNLKSVSYVFRNKTETSLVIKEPQNLYVTELSINITQVSDFEISNLLKVQYGKLTFISPRGFLCTKSKYIYTLFVKFKDPEGNITCEPLCYCQLTTENNASATDWSLLSDAQYRKIAKMEIIPVPYNFLESPWILSIISVAGLDLLICAVVLMWCYNDKMTARDREHELKQRFVDEEKRHQYTDETDNIYNQRYTDEFSDEEERFEEEFIPQPPAPLQMTESPRPSPSRIDPDSAYGGSVSGGHQTAERVPRVAASEIGNSSSSSRSQRQHRDPHWEQDDVGGRPPRHRDSDRSRHRDRYAASESGGRRTADNRRKRCGSQNDLLDEDHDRVDPRSNSMNRLNERSRRPEQNYDAPARGDPGYNHLQRRPPRQREHSDSPARREQRYDSRGGQSLGGGRTQGYDAPADPRYQPGGGNIHPNNPRNPRYN